MSPNPFLPGQSDLGARLLALRDAAVQGPIQQAQQMRPPSIPAPPRPMQARNDIGEGLGAIGDTLTDLGEQREESQRRKLKGEAIKAYRAGDYDTAEALALQGGFKDVLAGAAARREQARKTAASQATMSALGLGGGSGGGAVASPDMSAFDGAFQTASQTFGIQPDLLRAVAAQESSGDPSAVSPRGARGLFQVMPDTEAELRRKYGITAEGPEGDALLGAAYLKEGTDAYGHVIPTLARYNAGPGAVQKWLRPVEQGGLGDPRQGGMTWNEWAARIPYKETREYILGSPDGDNPGVLARLGGGRQQQAGLSPEARQRAAVFASDGELTGAEAASVLSADQAAKRQAATDQRQTLADQRQARRDARQAEQDERRVKADFLKDWRGRLDADAGLLPEDVMAATPAEKAAWARTRARQDWAAAGLEPPPPAIRGSFSSGSLAEMGPYQQAEVWQAVPQMTRSHLDAVLAYADEAGPGSIPPDALQALKARERELGDGAG